MYFIKFSKRGKTHVLLRKMSVYTLCRKDTDVEISHRQHLENIEKACKTCGHTKIEHKWVKLPKDVCKVLNASAGKICNACKRGLDQRIKRTKERMKWDKRDIKRYIKFKKELARCSQ